ncbi:hypothetical protein TorRG33x02_238670 [Trema orientale]|uniref:Uncharacterized protein n=1 Tax=Trema orientale TaxID=63057 RepID=A0A2P5DYC8_TREOI|nr:hypothetical protein TorRG33x02_238670 [Trema orientale]
MTVSRDISSSNVYLLCLQIKTILSRITYWECFSRMAESETNIRLQIYCNGHPLLPAFFFIVPNTKCVQIWLEQNSNTHFLKNVIFFFLTLSSASLLKVTRTGTTGANPFVPT